MPHYENMSPEEIRMQGYMRGNHGGPPVQGGMGDTTKTVLSNVPPTFGSSFAPISVTEKTEKAPPAGEQKPKVDSFQRSTPGGQRGDSQPPSGSSQLVNGGTFVFGQHSTEPSASNYSSPTTDFEALRQAHVRPLMDLNDRINVLTAKETKINSTRIVVAGDQSHGKTSLLEALCGINLPRGEGIQTRVPLILQIRRQGTQNIFGNDYATIAIDSSAAKGKQGAHKERILLSQIGDKVREYTNLAAGPGKNISDTPIQLSVFRNSQCDDLTLVDLPGITRVALLDQAGGDGRALEEQIMSMCRTYMKPPESILLNVVSSMVDFSTSASLQMSKELDPERKRTLLCITKVDQHKEQGLDEKIQKSIQAMRLNPQHVFAVRNRTQEENEVELPLEKVRHLEEAELEKLADGRVTEYQLGVRALSKYLVKIQCEEILQTLPRTRIAIEEGAALLEKDLEGLGKPVGDASACRAKAMQLIDACTSRLQGEALGQLHSELDTSSSCEGEAIELSMVPDFQTAAYRKGRTTYSSPVVAGQFTFNLSFESSDAKYVGIFLHVIKNAPKDVSITAVNVICEFKAISGHSTVAQRKMDHTYTFDEKTSLTGMGYAEFMKVAAAETSHDEVITFTANVFVEKVEVKGESAADGNSGLGSTIFSARLADLQEEFTSNVDQLYSKSHLLSESFRNSLARELKGTRGGLGLPGNIAPHVPVGMLRKLRTKLPSPIQEYRNKVLEECSSTAKAVIDQYVGKHVHPKLHGLFVECVCNIFQGQWIELERYHDKILEWEQSVCSSNHYFMDTVNKIKASINDDDESEKPLYLHNLSAKTISAMSNQDQKLVDIQIEIFAYWKLMKKRLVDYIILSTHTELINTPINKTLKEKLMEAVFRHDDNGLVRLLNPDPVTVRRRDNLVSRLEKLRQAMEEIEEYKRKYPGGWVDIE